MTPVILVKSLSGDAISMSKEMLRSRTGNKGAKHDARTMQPSAAADGGYSLGAGPA